MIKDFQQDKAQQRLRSFDFLRGLAILGVIAVHATQKFPSNLEFVDYIFGLGRFGVQLFYFISALTMCYMWEQRGGGGEKKPIRKFYIRRILRIAPLFWLAIPVYIFLNGLGMTYWAPEGVGVRQVLLTSTFLHGFWPDSINSVVPGGWSIAVEMTFYLVFPFVILAFRDKKMLYLYTALLLWLFNVFIFKDFLSDFFAKNYHTDSATIVKDFLYMNFVNQAPVFLLGCYLYFLLRTNIERPDTILFVAWIAVAVCSKYFFGKNALGFFVVVLALGLFVSISVGMKLKLKPLELLGRNSYSIYLSHFFVLSMLAAILPYKNGPVALLMGGTLTVLISYALSVLVYVLIEKRVHRFALYITDSK